MYMFKRLLVLILLAGCAYAGYVYGFNKGFDAGVHMIVSSPTAKLTEKPKVDLKIDLENMKRAITGSWQSIADKKLVRTYAEAGEVIDTYANKKVSAGVFTLFSSVTAKEDDVSFVLDKGRVYIAVSDAAAQNETGTSTEGISYFRIDLITPNELKVTVMGEKEQKAFSFKKI